jgi:hypothetical protein
MSAGGTGTSGAMGEGIAASCSTKLAAVVLSFGVFAGLPPFGGDAVHAWALREAKTITVSKYLMVGWDKGFGI